MRCRSIVLLAGLSLCHCQSWGRFWEVSTENQGLGNQGIFAWGGGPSVAGNISTFGAVATDRDGNAYAAGDQYGSGLFTFGTQSLNGSTSTNNALLVKYDRDGNVVWIRGPNPAPGLSVFQSVATDSGGNVYAGGNNGATGTFTFSGTNLAGVGGAVIVKYNSSGNGLWSVTSNAVCGNSNFFVLATDTSDNVYAAGRQSSPSCTYGAQTVTAAYAGTNPLLVKFNSAGTPLWGSSTAASTCGGDFRGLATDSAGNIYAVGNQSSCAITYAGQTIPAGTGTRAIIVKYSSAGVAQWGFTAQDPGGATSSFFDGITIDKDGNLVVVGSQTSPASYGSFTLTPSNGTSKGVLVKLNPAGQVLAAQLSDVADTSFYGVRTDSLGNIYVAGTQTGNLTALYGGLSVPKSSTEQQTVVIKYNAAGAGQWARLPTSTPGGSTQNLYDLAIGYNDQLIAVGQQTPAGNFVYDTQTITNPLGAQSALILQYR